jgi:hypothetical protein
MDRRNCEPNILQFKHILKQNLEDFELFDSQGLDRFRIFLFKGTDKNSYKVCYMLD